MAYVKKGPETEFEKLAKKIGTDGEDIIKELEAADLEELNKRIAQANQSIVETKAELDANENYVKVCEDKKLLSSGFSEVKKRQNAIIKVAIQLRQAKGAA